MLRHASVKHFLRKIHLGLTSPDDFLNIEVGTANVVIKIGYNGDVEEWLKIVNNMGQANPEVFGFILKNESQFVIDLKKTL